MPIDPEFPVNQKLVGKLMHSDSEQFHFVWGSGIKTPCTAGHLIKSKHR